LRDCKTSKREEKLGKKSKWKDSRKKEEIGEVLFIDKYKIEVMVGGGGEEEEEKEGGGGEEEEEEEEGGGGEEEEEEEEEEGGGGGGRRRRRRNKEVIGQLRPLGALLPEINSSYLLCGRLLGLHCMSDKVTGIEKSLPLPEKKLPFSSHLPLIARTTIAWH